MKHLSLLLLAVSVLFALGSYAQEPKDTVVLAFNDLLVATSPETAEFSGYAVRAANGWSAVIYNDDMKVIARGGYISSSCKVKEGWFTFYYPNGTRAANGQFHEDKRIGTWRTWYPTGILRDSLDYKKDKPEGMYFSFFESGKISGKGAFRDGFEDGTWTWYHYNGTVASVEEFSKGKLKGMRCMDSTGKVQLSNCELYTDPVTSDNKDLWQLIYATAPEPRDETGRIMDGIVNVEIHITETGEVKQLAVSPGSNKKLDDAVRKALEKPVRWKPAYNHNRPIAFVRTVSVPFGSKRFDNDAYIKNKYGGQRLPDYNQPRPPAGYYWNVDRDGQMITNY